jgi:thiol peroxidase
MTDRTGVITFKGNPLTLVGSQPRVGRKAPAFTVVANDLTPLTLAQFAGKVVVISAVPSLDTATCNIETRRFDQEAVKLGPEVAVLTVSMDLPFAQSRWSGAAGVHAVVTGSDYRDAQFGKKYGVLIKELRLLARALFVVDAKGKLVYQQLVPEVSHEPNYDEVLDVVKALQLAEQPKATPQPVGAMTR